jgi:hypothetical protein
LVLAILLGIWAFFMKVADSELSDDPTTGRYYVGLKTRLASDFEAAKERTWEDLEQKYRGMFGGSGGNAPGAASVASGTAGAAPVGEGANAASGERHSAMRASEASAAPAGPLRLLPYVTVGLTRDEVIAAQGEPTSASEDKLMYGASELDMKDGKVVGWKLDGRSSIRVKLWPEGPVDTGLRAFGVGSTKDEVLVVQGTPTSFSADRFEYGSSVVYFRNNRVMGWRDGSVGLRVER